MTTDARLIAAHLAAALIAGKPLDKANGGAGGSCKALF